MNILISHINIIDHRYAYCSYQPTARFSGADDRNTTLSRKQKTLKTQKAAQCASE